MVQLINLASLVVLLALPGSLLAGDRQQHKHAGAITVVGIGEVSATPDTVEFPVGALTQIASAARALDDNNKIISNVRKVLERFQIAERDLQTQRFDVAPQYKPGRSNAEAPELTGYRVNHVLHVKLRRPTELGELLDALIGAGSNVLHGVFFSVGSPAELKDEARALAVTDAERKARQLAEVGAVTLGRVNRASGSA